MLFCYALGPGGGFSVDDCVLNLVYIERILRNSLPEGLIKGGLELMPSFGSKFLLPTYYLSKKAVKFLVFSVKWGDTSCI